MAGCDFTVGTTSGKGSYRNCSKIFDPHGDGFSIGPTD
jgi:hypothetical protein